MWIRSQNKECLLKCNTINIATEEGTDGYIIFEYIGNNNYINLGIYKSKERVLEVLDEIEEIIKKHELYKSQCSLTSNEIIYQMPEEWLNGRRIYI